MDALQQAKAYLEQEGYTCVACRGQTCYTSRARGVRPLLQWLEDGQELKGFYVADRVVGRATAFLYCLLGVAAVYTPIISTPALAVLEANGIRVVFDRQVSYIQNRTGDGRCPMETATLHCQTPQQALAAIRTALSKLQQG